MTGVQTCALPIWVIVVEASGNEIVAVKRRGLTEEQWKKYAIADNTASDFSTWDADVLSEIAQEVDLSSFFPDDKLEELLGVIASLSDDELENEGNTQEIDPDEFEFECTCPKCGFQFNK